MKKSTSGKLSLFASFAIASFKNFRQALAFTNQVGALAEQEGHHPDILLSYGKVTIRLWTHKINGLSESDFILAAKCDTIKLS